MRMVLVMEKKKPVDNLSLLDTWGDVLMTGPFRRPSFVGLCVCVAHRSAVPDTSYSVILN